MTSNKQTLTKKEVLHIAKLANLDLTNEESVKLQKQLSQTLDYVDILNELNTAKIKITSQTTGSSNVLREDIVKPSLTQAQALSNSKDKHDGYFKVKSIFE